MREPTVALVEHLERAGFRVLGVREIPFNTYDAVRLDVGKARVEEAERMLRLTLDPESYPVRILGQYLKVRCYVARPSCASLPRVTALSGCMSCAGSGWLPVGEDELRRCACSEKC